MNPHPEEHRESDASRRTSQIKRSEPRPSRRGFTAPQDEDIFFVLFPIRYSL